MLSGQNNLLISGSACRSALLMKGGCTLHLKNLEALIDGSDEVTLGRVGPIRRAAIACDDDQQLAALVRCPGGVPRSVAWDTDPIPEKYRDAVESGIRQLLLPAGALSEAKLPRVRVRVVGGSDHPVDST